MTEPRASLADLLDGLQASSPLRELDRAVWEDLEVALERLELRSGELLFRQDDRGDGMYVIIAGSLAVSTTRASGTEVPLGVLRAGDTVGEIQLLTGGRRSATVHAAEDCELVKIPAEAFESLAARSPELLQLMADVARRRLRLSLMATALPRVFGRLDAAALQILEAEAEWVHLRSGEILFEQGTPGDTFYVVASGRLAAILEDEDDQRQLGSEIGRGECIGEMAVLSGEPRSATVRAVRDSRLVAFPAERCPYLCSHFPQLVLRVLRILADRLARSTTGQLPAATVGSARTVAIVPATGGARTGELTRRLIEALSRYGETRHLSRRRLDAFGPRVRADEPDDDLVRLRLLPWLDDQELRFRFLVFEAEPESTVWTRLCLRQADQILVVADAGTPPESGFWQRVLGGRPVDVGMTSRATLVLVHDDGRRWPRDTRRQLDAFALERHFHLRRDRPEDLGRLARYLAGRAVGLALGGGGARGFAHIGVLRALEEAGVAVDMIGGTSMGALIATQFAMLGDPEALVEINRRAFLAGKPHRDFTLPIFGLLSGRRAERLMDELFRGRDLEDLWLNCFAVSANLTKARQVIHRGGPVSAAVRASMAVPGIVVPALHGDDLLVDGGVLNNLPGDVMQGLCGGRVILVDVSPGSDLTFKAPGGRLPSAWQVARNRLDPFAEGVEAPSLLEILTRASSLTSIRSAELAKSRADLYLKPPIERFGMFEVSAIETIIDTGYHYARSRLEEWDGLESWERPEAP